MIKLFEQFNEYNQIKKWLDKMEVRNYTINYDLTVDIDGSVDISGMNLSNIPIQFGKVNGSFFCNNNKLTSLKGSPNIVNGDFSCSINELTSLESCPKLITGHFICRLNKLITLKYLPVIKGLLDFYDNPLPTEFIKFRSWKTALKYMDDYGIWNSDGSFNEARWNIFENDYNNGVIN